MNIEGYQREYSGLIPEEIENSRKTYGINCLNTVKKETWWIKILKIFKEPMFLLLIVTATIYFLLGEFRDGMIMLVFVFFVSGIELFQEWKTDRALESLKILIALNTKVIRGGKLYEIDSEELVVGDIVLLEEGDRISADGIILECHDFGIDESILTGESDIVFKNTNPDDNHFAKNRCYSGTNITGGSGIIQITAVGSETEYGKIGKNLGEIKREKTPLEKQIKKLIQICAIISLCFCIGVIIVTFFANPNQDTIVWERITSSILSGITVAMATIPEEIPVILTVFLAMGSWSLVKKKALIRNMPTVETLGAVTVLCVDKTGTLTKNEMEVIRTYGEKSLGYYAALACETNPYDPMEKAILEYANQVGVSKDIFLNPFVHEYSFRANTKMMGHIWNIENRNVLVVKGAYENVLPLCKLEDQEVKNKIDEYAKQGYRILAVAINDNLKEIGKDISDNPLHFVGLLAFVDPPREGVIQSIKDCNRAGIRIIMITGDNGETAKGIAKQIELPHEDNVITGLELEKMSDEELKKRLACVSIFARVYPSHKMRIVEALQKNGEVVAMTGDGVNDAPALKKAEIGIAMGKRGTNVVKEASDMVLLDDNFTTIVDAVTNGRRIYQNIRKAICYVFVIHIPIACLSLFIPLLHLPILLLPVHIVLLELIIDPTSSIIFEQLKVDSDIMLDPPRKIRESLISKKMVWKSIVQGLVIFMVILGTYVTLLNDHTEAYAITCSLSILILSNIFLVFVNQSNHLSIVNFIQNLKNRAVLLINIIIFIGLLTLIYLPIAANVVGFTSLSFCTFLIIVLISMLSTMWYDVVKVISRKKCV